MELLDWLVGLVGWVDVVYTLYYGLVGSSYLYKWEMVYIAYIGYCVLIVVIVDIWCQVAVVFWRVIDCCGDWLFVCY